MADRPVLIEIEDQSPAPSPAEAPPVEDTGAPPTGQAMQTLATLAARPPSRLSTWFWRLAFALVTFLAGVAAWDFVTAMLDRNPVVAAAALLLFGLFATVCLAIVIKEVAALARLQRVDHLRARADAARADSDLLEARALAKSMTKFYKGRPGTAWGAEQLHDRIEESFDAETLFLAVEDQLLAPLDARAKREVEAAARQVATVTALIPLAFADVIAAMTANIRMIRKVAEVYGGRSGTLGSWRLTRAVLSHLVATGAVAIGDDLLGSVGGGQILARVSRRFGEGLVNGALTARVGVAAMEVCRPLAFSPARRPRVSRLVGRALTGLFEKRSELTETSPS